MCGAVGRTVEAAVDRQAEGACPGGRQESGRAQRILLERNESETRAEAADERREETAAATGITEPSQGTREWNCHLLLTHKNMAF